VYEGECKLLARKGGHKRTKTGALIKKTICGRQENVGCPVKRLTTVNVSFPSA
jgi:hypothetical protein